MRASVEQTSFSTHGTKCGLEAWHVSRHDGFMFQTRCLTLLALLLLPLCSRGESMNDALARATAAVRAGRAYRAYPGKPFPQIHQL